MWWFLGAFAAVILIIFGFLYWIYTFAFRSPDKHQNDIYYLPSGFDSGTDTDTYHGWVRAMDEVPYEAVSMVNREGLNLGGRYYHTGDGLPVAICFHGYRSHYLKDFCGGGRLLPTLGYNVLLVEQRAHCGAEGKTITFGIKESNDCIDWINYALDRFGGDTKVLLYGISMGASTVLMAAGKKDLPKNVYGIVADCPYSSPKAILKKVSGDLKFHPDIVYPFIWLAARIFGGFSLNEWDCIRSVKNSPVPILLLHGEEDGFVPPYMSRDIAKAAGDKAALHTFAGADHGISYVIQPEQYKKAVIDFTNRIAKSTD